MSHNYDSLVTRLTGSARRHPRRYRTRVAALAIIAAAACGTAGSGERESADRSAAADSAAVRAVRARYPRAQVRSPEVVAVPGTAYRSGMLWFETPGDDRAYGTVVAVWTADEGRLLWTHEHSGDNRPHRLVWLDADADGRSDLFFTSGEETSYETYLFTNRTGSSAAPDSAFALAYRSGNGYTTLLDLDGDGAPELIDSGHAGDEHVETPECSESPAPAGVKQSAAREYARHVASFDAANHKYGFDEFAHWTLHLLERVKILQIREGKLRDSTRAFPEHLLWRVGVLETWRASATPACRARLDRIIHHLRRSAA